MKLKFWQKLYLSTLMVFLIFFNSGVFVIVSSQNSKALSQQKENLLTQQEYILQQIINDMTLVYESRPLGISMIISQYGNRYLNNGVLMQVKKGEELVWSSFGDSVDLKNNYLTNRISEIKDINGYKFFVVECNLPSPFESYGTVLAFPVQEFFDNWYNTIFVINILCCCVSAVTAFVLYGVLRRLTKPIQDLSEAAVQFGSGNLEVRIKRITDDEIGETAHNFNIMAQQISSQMQTLAQSAQEKQNFIDDFSHEMRTPLTAIRGYSQYMQQARLTDEEYYSTLEIIDHNAYRLQNLSESMLALSLSEKEDDIVFCPVSIAEVLDNIKTAHQPRINDSNIKFEIACGGDVFVNGDFALIESLIGNLADNAINACNANEFKTDHYIKISAFADEEKIFITVEDNGIGMSDETVQKIHQPFYREDKARSRKNGGAGLGGAITKKITDLHNATLTYVSAVNVGTIATIEFTTT